ncbi:MAG: hypothetical protein KDD69_11435 [Bdellovibrionales bacterium]|nr:hypothetical protein [Bdellovibrionales bacterium]
METKWPLLATNLRRLGGVLLAAAAGTFLVQGWLGGDSMQRYFTFAGFTAVLIAAALLTGIRLQDTKGARVYVAVTLGALPALMAQLGAILLALVSGPMESVPLAFRFQAAPSLAVTAAGAVGGVLLWLGSRFGLRVLSSSHLHSLLKVFIFGNLLLLVPTRDPEAIAVLMSVQVVWLTFLNLRSLTDLTTSEGILARVTVAFPCLLLGVRNASFYPNTPLFYAAMFGAAWLVMFVWSRALLRESIAEKFQACSIFPALISFAYAAEAFGVDDRFAIPAIGVPFAGFLLASSFSAVGSGRGYRKLASFIAVASCGHYLLHVGGTSASLLSLLTGAVLVATASAIQERNVLAAGMVLSAVGMLYHLRFAITLYSLSPWLSLAVAGIVVVMLSTVVERYHRTLVRLHGSASAALKNWS